MSRFKKGDRVRVLPGGVGGNHGGITTPIPFDTVVSGDRPMWITEIQVENPDPKDAHERAHPHWFVPEEYLVPLDGTSTTPGRTELVVWPRKETTWYEVRVGESVVERVDYEAVAIGIARSSIWTDEEREAGITVVKVTE